MWVPGNWEMGMGSEAEKVDLGAEKSLEVRIGWRVVAMLKVGVLGFEKREKWVQRDMRVLGT